jgi:hypothetical protein
MPPDASGWTVETVRLLFTQQVDNLRERFEEGRSESDLRYQQRFDASERALAAALAAVERSITAALAASEKAIEKAEIAQHAMNVSLSEQLNASIKTLSDKVTQTALDVGKQNGAQTGVSHFVTTFIAIAGLIVATLVAVFTILHAAADPATHHQAIGGNTPADIRPG